MLETKYILFKKEVIELHKTDKGFWEDSNNTLYAYKDGLTKDSLNRCGVWPVSIPTWPLFQLINDACSPHDFMYTSPVYQAFHTRSEADAQLQHLITLSGHPILGEIFHELARLLGAGYWENDTTNK